MYLIILQITFSVKFLSRFFPKQKCCISENNVNIEDIDWMEGIIVIMVTTLA